MTKRAGFPMNLWVDGYSLHGDVGAISGLSTSRGLMEDTGIDKSAVERLLLRADVKCAFKSFFNDSAGAIFPAFKARPTTSRVVLLSLGITRGCPAIGFTAKQANFDHEEAESGAVTATTDFEGSDGYAPEWGEMVSAAAENHASAGSKTSLDGAAQTTAGASFHWASPGAASGSAINVLVEHASDNATWSTLATLTTVLTTAVLSGRVKVSGTVKRYTRVTTTGTFTDAPIAVEMRRGLAVDTVAY